MKSVPDSLVKEVGLTSDDGDVPDLLIRNHICTLEQPPDKHTCLASLNDDGLTFLQIADVIEYFFPGDPE